MENITFRMDATTKAQMVEICRRIGMSPSTAFNVFANAFVREKGFPFHVSAKDSVTVVSREELMADAKKEIAELDHDYRRLAE